MLQLKIIALAAAVMTLHAQNNCPLYHLKKANLSLIKFFNPGFKENIYFVYLNKKQSSKTAIANYQNNKTKI
jgi:predicted porin